MRTIYIYSAVLLFAVSSLLSSCAFLLRHNVQSPSFIGQKNEFAQRKYYDFPRGKHAFEKIQSKRTSVPSIEKTTFINSIQKQEKKIHEPASTASAAKEIILPKNEICVFYSPIDAGVKSMNYKKHSENSTVLIKKPEAFKHAAKKSIYNHASDADLMLIVLVLLSIFFPPLGVYMKDHGTSNWFWLTLVLCLIAIFGWGIGIVSLGGGLWFAAAIIAILHVFDLI